MLGYITLHQPEVKGVTFILDNGSGFASHDNVPFVFHLNERLATKVKVRGWVFTEACTGKDEEDTHFSFINALFQAFINDGNDIGKGYVPCFEIPEWLSWISCPPH